jgi:D-serine deaminase-like pyridoxal phosphate-dependent protein
MLRSIPVSCSEILVILNPGHEDCSMDPYFIKDTSRIITPAVIVFRDMVEQNIDHMIQIAGDPARLRPHCKTHKTRQIIEMEVARGITKHKAATFAEAEMLAEAGATDVFLAYNLVGPNIARAVEFLKKFPNVALSVTGDHEKPLRQLSEAMRTAGLKIGVLLDIDTGQHRTGVPVGGPARELYRLIVSLPGLIPAGLHVYDGHQHQTTREDRRAAVDAEFHKVLEFRDSLLAEGWPVPRLVCGGTASFPIYAEKTDPAIEMSPGTCVYNDAGYGERFPDLVFPAAAVMLTRVVSRPTHERITLDLGYKAVASDPPAGNRLIFPALPDAKQVLQNEEHLVLETPEADRFAPGDELIAIPRHICPTSALHKEVYVVSNGEVVDRWPVASRDRWITI